MRFPQFLLLLMVWALSWVARADRPHCRDYIDIFAPHSERAPDLAVGQGEAAPIRLAEKIFAQIFDGVGQGKQKVSEYRYENKVQTSNLPGAPHADDFLAAAHEIFGAELGLRNASNCVTITEQRRIESVDESGKKYRSVKIRTRAFLELDPDQGMIDTFSAYASTAKRNYVRLYDHEPDDIPVRFEFKKDALDPATGQLVEGVVEKPVIFCAKREVDLLLDPDTYWKNRDALIEKIKSHAKRGVAVNRPEDVEAMIFALGKLHELGIPLKNPTEASLYQRTALEGPNGVQITIDHNIRYILFNRKQDEDNTYDFPLEARVIEYKIPVFIMAELRRLQAIREDPTKDFAQREANFARTLESHPFRREYELWRRFEGLPSMVGFERGRGKSSNGRRAVRSTTLWPHN